MLHCPDDNVVLAFAAGKLRPAEMASIEPHLSVCESCLGLVAIAARSAAPLRTVELDRTFAASRRYRIAAAVGCGGNGIVYRAHDLESGQQVALKVVQMRGPEPLAAIRREIFALSRLRHPGIVRVLDHGVDRGCPWYAMEYLEGDTLAATRSRLFGSADARPGAAAGGHLDEVLDIVRRLCEPLGYLHGEGLVHRDLKPHNVLVQANREPVLIDFGLSRRASGSSTREPVEAPRIDGTPWYMAPEQIAGEGVDARADLYALGCILYELVTGRPPFVGKTRSAVLRQHLNTAPPPLGNFVACVAPRLEALVQALLAKDRRKRLGHADDVVEELERLGARSHVAAPHPVRRAHVYRPALTGRSTQLQQLGDWAMAACDGHGGLALVFGESGSGKTFLVTEVARSCPGMLVIEGSCFAADLAGGPTGVLTAFHGLLEVIADRCVTLGEAETERLLGLRARVLARLAPRLSDLPGPRGRVSASELTGTAARDQLFDALRETLAMLADGQPVLLLLDDLQWADDLTLNFLGTLGPEYFAGLKLFILATCRSEERPAALGELAQRSYVRSVVLGRLDAASARSIISDMLAWDTPPDELVEALAHNAEGNPFFVAEYVRGAVAEGLLRREDGAWMTERPPRSWSLPPTLRELVARRLRTLSPSAQAHCQAAAVLGREFQIELLQDCLADDAGSGAGLDGTAELVASQVLEAAEARTLRFVHHKLHEVAYEQIPAARQRALHARAALHIERRYGTDSPGRFAALAQHWAGAAQPERAQRYFVRAGQHALDVAAYQQAAHMFGRAIELELASGGQHAGSVERTDLRLGLARALFGLGELDKLEEQAWLILASVGCRRPTTRGQWFSLLGRQLAIQLGHVARAPAACAAQHAAQHRAALAATMLSEAYFYREDFVRMAAAVLLAINAADLMAADVRLPRAYVTMAGLAGLMRAERLSRRYFRLAHAAADALGDTAERAMADAVEVVVYGSLGQWARAQASAERLAAKVSTIVDPVVRGHVIATLCQLEFFTGNYAAAEAHALELFRTAAATSTAHFAKWGAFLVARSLVQRGNIEEALPLLNGALKALELHPELQTEIACFGLSALVQLQMKRDDDARSLADAALARIVRSSPTGYPSLDGYQAVVEVYRTLRASTAITGPLDERYRRARRALWKMALLHPVARPAALFETGHAAALAGHGRLARLCFAWSASWTARSGMRAQRALS